MEIFDLGQDFIKFIWYRIRDDKQRSLLVHKKLLDKWDLKLDKENKRSFGLLPCIMKKISTQVDYFFERIIE